MSAIPKDGYKPSPVYEAHLSDGEVIRLSFYSSSRKPIDFAAGRRAMEAIALAVDTRRKITPRPGETREAASVKRWQYKSRAKLGGVYTEPMLHCWRVPYSRDVTSPKHPWVRGADGVMRRPVPRRKGVSILSAFVEHPTIGRVEHDPKATPVAAKRKLTARATLAEVKRLLDTGAVLAAQQYVEQMLAA